MLTHIAMQVEDQQKCIDFYKTYCNMKVVHDRTDNDNRIVWIAEPGREKEFIFVIMPKGKPLNQRENDYSHLGFAVESKEEVDRLAAKAQKEGILMWPPVQEPFPVGYYCGIKDPNGTIIEFSYGQPLSGC